MCHSLLQDQRMEPLDLSGWRSFFTYWCVPAILKGLNTLFLVQPRRWNILDITTLIKNQEHSYCFRHHIAHIWSVENSDVFIAILSELYFSEFLYFSLRLCVSFGANQFYAVSKSSRLPSTVSLPLRLTSLSTSRL